MPALAVLLPLGILAGDPAVTGGPANPENMNLLQRVVSWTLSPGLMAVAIALTDRAIASGNPALWFNLTYLGLAAILFCLERLMPHERLWLRNDGQILTDLSHTLFNKGLAQALIVFGTALMAPGLLDSPSGIWPGDWPFALQVVLGLTIAEFGMYWAHRLSHEWPLLWRLHAVHHSAPRLWIVNTGRFHFLDTMLSLFMGLAVLVALGCPQDVLLMGSAIHAFIGILTHCNIEMRFGRLNWLFNTPAVHRWHHSMDLDQGNRNYGENLMIFDHLFGTYFFADRKPPSVIGIREAMPKSFLGQLAAPFRWRRLQAAKPLVQPAE
jgi:sterol desaturase/sphingolipid hydroxylase (fatty acid hydroxylase superfamily)